MKQPTKRTVIANAFATLGYISLLFQWAWSVLLLCYPLLVNRPDFLIPTSPTTSQPESIELSPALSPIATVIAVAVTIFILVATVIVLARLPRTIGQRAATLTKATANSVVPAITHHKKITKKQRMKLSHRVILGLKLVSIIVPLILLFFVDFTGPILPAATWTVALFCAACSFTYFTVQQGIALIGKINPEKLW